jgi:hypothetical protein
VRKALGVLAHHARRGRGDLALGGLGEGAQVGLVDREGARVLPDEARLAGVDPPVHERHHREEAHRLLRLVLAVDRRRERVRAGGRERVGVDLAAEDDVGRGDDRRAVHGRDASVPVRERDGPHGAEQDVAVRL